MKQAENAVRFSKFGVVLKKPRSVKGGSLTLRAGSMVRTFEREFISESNFEKTILNDTCVLPGKKANPNYIVGTYSNESFDFKARGQFERQVKLYYNTTNNVYNTNCRLCPYPSSSRFETSDFR